VAQGEEGYDAVCRGRAGLVNDAADCPEYGGSRGKGCDVVGVGLRNRRYDTVIQKVDMVGGGLKCHTYVHGWKQCRERRRGVL